MLMLDEATFQILNIIKSDIFENISFYSEKAIRKNVIVLKFLAKHSFKDDDEWFSYSLFL